MASPLTPKQRSAIQRAQRLPDLQLMLFGKAKGLGWLHGFQEAGFLAPENIPKPIPAEQEGYVSVPVWPIVNYLANNSDGLELPENLEEAKLVLEFIRLSSAYAKDAGISNYRVWWQMAKVISSMPLELLRPTDAEMIDVWILDPLDRGLVAEVIGEVLLPKLLKARTEATSTIALLLLQSIYRVDFLPGQGALSERQEASFRIDKWHAEKITKSIAREVGVYLGQNGVRFFLNVLQGVLNVLANDGWSGMWRPAIEDHEQNAARDDAEQILIVALRESVIGFVDSAPPEERDKVIRDLLTSDYVVVARVALYTIDLRFAHLQDFSALVANPKFYDENYRHELWQFLHRHYGSLSHGLRAEAAGIIDGMKEEDGSPATYLQAIWLSAIKGFARDLQQRYEGLVAVLGSEPDHPDFSSYMSSGWVGDESPVDPKVLQAMGMDELELTLNNFKDPNSPFAPSKRGLAKAFHAIVKASPTQFSQNFERIRRWDLAYVYEAIEAFRELWEEKAALPWDAIWRDLLSGLLGLTKSTDFWGSENSVPQTSFVGNRHWVVGAASRLIEGGAKSDERAFPVDLMSLAREVCMSILEHQDGEDFKLNSDAVSIAINSPRGKAVEAMIVLARRACRLEKTAQGTTSTAWSQYEAFFQSELERSRSRNFEFATLVTNYLPNFLFMSSDWVKRNLTAIFDRSSRQAWLCAMQGYAYIGRVYEVIYRHLADTGQLIDALDEPLLKERVSRTIVQQIGVAYVNGFESLEDSTGTVRNLLKRGRPDEIIELIWFMWTLRPEKHVVDEKLRASVFSLWRAILSSIDTESKAGRKIASHLCDWIAFVDRIDVNTRPLIDAVLPWSKEDFRTYELLTSIARISQVQPLEAADLWLRMLKVSLFDFPEEAVDEGLRNILKAGNPGIALAKKIAGEYLRGGNEKPRQLLEKSMANEISP